MRLQLMRLQLCSYSDRKTDEPLLSLDWHSVSSKLLPPAVGSKVWLHECSVPLIVPQQLQPYRRGPENSCLLVYRLDDICSFTLTQPVVSNCKSAQGGVRPIRRVEQGISRYMILGSVIDLMMSHCSDHLSSGREERLRILLLEGKGSRGSKSDVCLLRARPQSQPRPTASGPYVCSLKPDVRCCSRS